MCTLSELQEICDEHNIDLENLPKVITNPKVIPMIRGIDNEFHTLARVNGILNRHPELNMSVEKPVVDDLLLRYGNSEFKKECKLASKKSFDMKKMKLKIKCMRSRTLGVEEAKIRSEKKGLSHASLLMHNDQYRVDDFAMLYARLENAFDLKCEKTLKFLEEREISIEWIKKAIIYAPSHKITSSKDNPICRRRKCDKDCGFIPNYPVVYLNEELNPKSPWKLLPFE